jgi:hypothetical protein
MPLPEPKTKESNADFIGRCMGDDVMVEEYPDQKQRAAVCNAQIEATELAANRNKSGADKARQLVREGRVVETRKWSGPSAAEENKFIEENGWEKYGEYFLGRDYQYDKETKAHWKYPFSNDFASVNINGLRAIRTRAAQTREDDIFATAGVLLEEAKKKIENKELEALDAAKTFSTICLEAKAGVVDAERGLISDISIISAGEAKGHHMMISTKTLDSAITLLLGKTLPAYLSHNGATGDRLLTEAGYFTQFYRDGDQIRAGKFVALESFKKYEREKYDRLFEIAAVAPQSFGVSIVFEGQLFWEMKDGSEESIELGYEAPENARFEYPTVRPLKITSADFVDSPAANGALFNAKGDKSLKGKEMNASTTETVPPAEPQSDEIVDALGASNESASAAHEAAQEPQPKAEPPKKKKKKKALAEQDEEDRKDEERGEEDEIAKEDQGEEVAKEEDEAIERDDDEEPDADKLEEPDDEYQEKMRAVVEEIGTHIAEVYNGFGKVMERFDELKRMTGDHRVEEKSDEKEMDEVAELKARVDELTKLHAGTAPIKDSDSGKQTKTKDEIKSDLIEKYLSTHPDACRSTAVLEVYKNKPELFAQNN